MALKHQALPDQATQENFLDVDNRLGFFEGKIYRGFGTPEATVKANPGAIYLNDSGGPSTTLYMKESGTSNTGWSPVGAASAAGLHNLLSATHPDTVADSVVAGDLIIGNATPKWARLAAGSNGQVLTLSGGLPTWAAASGGATALLDGSTHTDTTNSAVTRGDLIVGNSTPAWDDLAIGAAGFILNSNGTDPSWGNTLTSASGSASLKLVPSGAVGITTSAGGALNLDNSASTGAGAVFYSNQGAGALGRLLVVNVANTANPQAALRVENAGTNAAISVNNTGTSTGASALDVTSSDRTVSAIGFQGAESGKGTLKVTHVHPAAAVANDDSGAAVLRLNWTDVAANGTAVQGIFMSAEALGPTTTGDLLDIYPGPTASTTNILKLTAAGQLRLAVTGTTGGLLLGGDAQVIRAGANQVGVGTGDTFLISDFTNATHTHTNAAGGGTLTPAAIGADADLATFSLPASTTISAFGATLVDDANAAASIATLGLDADLATFALPASTTISAFGATLIDDANAAASIATLGLDADLATFALPSSTTISAFGASLIDDAAASNARTTLGLGTIATEAEVNYALLAGRSGGQTLIGGTAVTESLTLKANSGAITTGGMVFDFSATAASATGRFGTSYMLPTSLSGAHTAFVIGLDNAGASQTVALGGGGGVRALNLGGTYNYSGDPNTTSALVFQFGATMALDGTAATNLNGVRVFQSAPIYTMTAATTYGSVATAAQQHVGFRSNATYTAEPTSTATVPVFQHFECGPMTIGTGWTHTTWRGSYINAPVGAGAVGTMVAHDIEDLTTFPVPGAPTGVASAGAGLTAGNYRYKITFVNATGESAGGTELSGVAVSGGNLQITLSSIPLGPSGTTSRKVYRTASGGGTGTEKFVATIADNTTTTYVDSLADGSLGVAVPTVGTFTTPISLRSVGAVVEMRHAGPALFGTTGGPSNASVGLEVGSTTKAFLPSRLTSTQRDALAALAGMTFWNTTTSKLQVCTVAGTPGTFVDLH